jgi:DUF177 domain-containing protein
MLIEVSQIPPEGLDIALSEETLDLGEPADTWDGPASVQAELHVGRSGRGVLISGSFSSDIPLVCSRCLEPFHFQIGDRFDLYCEVGAEGLRGEEHELANDELDVTYLEEGRINTDHLLRENILLSLPVQPLCHEDCRGLCSRCGANLNQGACTCTETRMDPRLEALRKLQKPTLPEAGSTASADIV